MNLKVGKFRVEAKLLNDSSILARSKTRIILGLCTSNNHLARGEDQSRRLGITDTHDDGRETLKSCLAQIDMNLYGSQHLRIVFSIPSMQRNRLEIQAAIKVNRGDDVS